MYTTEQYWNVNYNFSKPRSTGGSIALVAMSVRGHSALDAMPALCGSAVLAMRATSAPSRAARGAI